MNARSKSPRDVVAKFCRRHQIRRLALLRDKLTSSDDVDVLVEFAPEMRVGFFGLARIEEELSAVLDRPIHIMTFKSVERSPNPLFKEAIIDSAEIQYEQE